MVKLAFIGDAHLGYRHRFKTQRLRDYAKAFDEAVKKAVRLEPDAVVFLGDLFHHPRPDPVSMRAVLKQLLKVSGQCPAIVCVGNHEIEGHLGTAYAPIFEDVDEDIHVLTSENPHIGLRLGRKDVGFHGFEYTRNPRQAQATLKSVSSKADSDHNVLCLHQGIEGYLSPYELSLANLREAAANFDLIVSGHVHKHARISEIESTPTYYCGSTERISFNEAGNRNGFLFFDSDFENPRFVRLKTPKMDYVKRDFTGTVAQLNDLLKELVADSSAPLLRVEVAADVAGDLLDVRSDFSEYEKDKTILEVNVVPTSAEHQVSFERMNLDGDMIREYFDKTGVTNEELINTCVDLFEKYAS